MFEYRLAAAPDDAQYELAGGKILAADADGLMDALCIKFRCFEL